MNKYVVGLYDGTREIFEADTLAGAKWAAFNAFQEMGRVISFRDFLHVLKEAYQT